MSGGSAEIESQSFCEGNEGIAASSLATTGRFLPGNDRASFSSFPPSTSVMMSLHDESASLYAAGSLSFGRRRHGRKGGGRGRRERERELTEFSRRLRSHPRVHLPLQSLPLFTLFFTTSWDLFLARFLIDKE